tara:strand:- start:24489 stop:25004 length:516 start_codon:yes stop_codon:yes gene_type:complete
MRWWIIAIFFLGCSSHSVKDYKANKPEFKIKEFFNGDLKAHGTVLSRSGKLLSTFVVDMKGSWNGNEGVLDEDFVYSDGRKDKRIWRLKVKNDGSIEGRADDVNGVADGKIAGNAFHFTYSIQLPIDGEIYNLDFEDWMYLVDKNTLMAKTDMRKFGFKVGEILIVMRKVP